MNMELQKEDKKMKKNTISKPRTLKLSLSDDECEELAKLCGIYNIPIEKVVEDFIADLVSSSHSSNQEERKYAKQWFDNNPYVKSKDKTLLGYLLENGYDTDRFMELYQEGWQENKKNKELEKMISGYGPENLTYEYYCVDTWDDDKITFEEVKDGNEPHKYDEYRIKKGTNPDGKVITRYVVSEYITRFLRRNEAICENLYEGVVMDKGRKIGGETVGIYKTKQEAINSINKKVTSAMGTTFADDPDATEVSEYYAFERTFRLPDDMTEEEFDRKLNSIPWIAREIFDCVEWETDNVIATSPMDIVLTIFESENKKNVVKRVLFHDYKEASQYLEKLYDIFPSKPPVRAPKLLDLFNKRTYSKPKAMKAEVVVECTFDEYFCPQRINTDDCVSKEEFEKWLDEKIERLNNR